MSKAVLYKLAAFGLVGTIASSQTAHAVVLEQKWEAGKSLSYQTDISGTANVQIPADVPIIIAGIPLAVEVEGGGTTELHTVKVDPTGVGTVAVRVPKFDMSAQSMGMKGQLSILNESVKATLNGKALPLDVKNPLAKPEVGLRISSQGRFLGVESIKPVTAVPGVPAPVKAGQNGNGAVSQSLETPTSIVAAITRALPAFWPNRDVQNGETWQAEVSWPVPSKTDPQKTEPTQVGKWDLTLIGEENVDGRVLQRVGLVGDMNVDGDQLGKPPVQAKAVDGKPAQPGITGAKAKQNVKGDIWFDAAAGQIVRTDLVIGARVEANLSPKSQGWADFTGSLQMNLKKAV